MTCLYGIALRRDLELPVEYFLDSTIRREEVNE
jgi:hypothetical protein